MTPTFDMSKVFPEEVVIPEKVNITEVDSEELIVYDDVEGDGEDPGDEDPGDEDPDTFG
jgi:hypothetical protein